MIPTGKPLESWNDTAARRTLLDFVERVTKEGSADFIPIAERVAVFDNDGTLWCEKPMPIQLDFILRRLAHMAEKDSSLRDRQPWKVAYEKDYDWLGKAMVKHYKGDNSDLKVIAVAVQKAFGGMNVEEYESEVDAFLHSARHPTLGRSYSDCAYQPMVELLGYLEANGFTTYIASGGDRDFMRPATRHLYGIPRERVIGSSFGLHFKEGKNGGAVMYKPEIEFFDDGPEKPVRIWSRVGRRPILAAGNSNGDVEMLQFAGDTSRPTLRVLLLHDDKEREFDYKAGAERSLEQANAQGWTVVSIKNDWASVFGDARAAGGARNAA
jgi:phosphoglycolate phosphatase-like HAD superfamily hydrolase